MDKEKVAKDIREIFGRSSYTGIDNFINKVVDRIEIDEDALIQVFVADWVQPHKVGEIVEDISFIDLIVKACPIRIKEADDEKT